MRKTSRSIRHRMPGTATASTKIRESEFGNNASMIPMTRRPAEQRNQKNDSSMWDVIAISTQSTIPVTRSTQNIPVTKASTGPGTTSARPPNITPINPFRRQDSFASIELPLFSRVNSFVSRCQDERCLHEHPAAGRHRIQWPDIRSCRLWLISGSIPRKKSCLLFFRPDTC